MNMSYAPGGRLEQHHHRELERIRAVIAANLEAGRDQYAGLESHEIGRVNRASMWGDNGEAAPDPDEWARIVD